MSSCATIYLNLPQWDGGSWKIRFIYLVNQTSFRLTECPDKIPAVPLYLGADLLSKTNVRTENHPRYHAKFAKKGLATKIKFSPAFRFHGLKVPTANNSLWFYSIQGLFRVAFEMYSKEGQLAVLENFQDVWKSQLHDNSLKRSYILSVQLDSAPASSLQDPESTKKVSGLQDCQMEGETFETSAAQDYFCSFQNPRLEAEQSQSTVGTIKQKLLGISDKLCKSQSCSNLKIVLLLLRNIEQCMSENLEEKAVTETVLALLKAKDWGCLYSSSLLNCIGQWLGQQFHTANSKISQKVEGFKVQHIDRITDLPPAEELATDLFPEAMQMLLLHWMGLSEDSALEKRRTEYPILLLILEFANHNLITGVAHVLYSSLICK